MPLRLRRSAFLLGCAAVGLARPALARDQDDEFDPAMSSPTQALRVLLGRGDAVASAGCFTFNGRPYRGAFTRTPDGFIVNTVSLEQYLYSVVPLEMGAAWPAAALQAQAICARTYVLQRSNPRRNFDLVPSEADQVYGGIAAESPAARDAVDATNAQVLRYGDEFAQVLYSSCCGGHTEASSDAWGGAPFAYLGGVVCPYCASSPQFHWQRDVDLASLASAFVNELAPYGSLRGVRISATDPSGRARIVELTAERGSAFVKGAQFRQRLGGRQLPSLLIQKIAPHPEAPERITIEGGGLGHGVGLCQWGARGYALAGGSSHEILSLYFPGTDITHD